MTKQLALIIGGNGNGPMYNLTVPNSIANLNRNAGLFGTNLIHNGILILLYVAIILTLIFFLIGGVKWMLSQGDKKQVEEAQKTIMYSIIGLIVIFASFFIINLIGYIFGVPLIGNPFSGH